MEMLLPQGTPWVVEFPSASEVTPGCSPSDQRLKEDVSTDIDESHKSGWTSFTEATKHNDPFSHRKENSCRMVSQKALLKRTKAGLSPYFGDCRERGQERKLLIMGELTLFPQVQFSSVSQSCLTL